MSARTCVQVFLTCDAPACSTAPVMFENCNEGGLDTEGLCPYLSSWRAGWRWVSDKIYCANCAKAQKVA